MELFTIQCTTCRARLKVKDESAIGDILACPKCGSMVQVAPPDDWRPVGLSPLPGAEPPLASKPRPASASQTPATKARAVTPPVHTPPAHTPAPAAKNAPPVAPAAQAPSASGSMSASKSSLGLAAAATSVVMPPLPEVPSAPEPTLVASGAPQPPMLPTPPPVIAVAHEAASAVDANGPLQGLLARLKRDAWLWGGALAGGIVLGAGVWWFASSHGEVPQSTNPPAAVANNAAPDAQATETDAIEDTVVAEDALTTLPNAADAEATAVANGADAQAAASDATHEEPAASNATGASATDDRQQTKPASESDPKLASDTDNASPTAAATEATAQEGDHTATPAIKLEPLASKPTTDDAAANASATDGSDSSVGKTAEAAGADDAKPAAEPRKPGARPATNSPVTRRTVSQTEVDQRLTNALPRVSFQKVPLQRFVEFLNDLTNLPITIDEPALRKAGLDRQAPVSVQATGQTTGEILRAALAPLHLECSLVDGQLVITTGSPAETE